MSMGEMGSADRRSMLQEIRELREEVERRSQGDRDTGVQLHHQLARLEEHYTKRERQLNRQSE